MPERPGTETDPDEPTMEPEDVMGEPDEASTGEGELASDRVLAFSPRAILGGFALLAALILLLLRRRGGNASDR